MTVNKLFYISLGIAASLGMALIFYLVLNIDSSITSLVYNTKSNPAYFYIYIVLTILIIILAGINVSLLAHKWSPNLKKTAPTGISSLFHIASSACPTCGSWILSLIGVSSGLAAFPFYGLELKAVSFSLMLVPVMISLKEIKNNKICPVPENLSEPNENNHEKTKSKKTHFTILFVLISIFFVREIFTMLKSEPIFLKAAESSDYASLIVGNKNHNRGENENVLFKEIEKQVIPENGFQSKIYLHNSVLKMIESGVIDKEKFKGLYKNRGGMPEGLKNILSEANNNPILLTAENSHIYLNLLWPLGLSNYMEGNKESPVNGKNLFNFASTGGWTLGISQNGGEYFNKLKIVDLTFEQEALAIKIAKNSYRPCCGNSAFFQDCNHGSALLGLLELGASQELSENELYKEALAFNSFWFPDTYMQTALYFKVMKSKNWNEVDPKIVLGKDFSSASGFRKNVNKKLQELDLLPKPKSGAGCGV